MTESPYAIPDEDLVASARVPVEQQILEQPDRRLYNGDGAGGPVPGGDALDADGE